MYHLTTMLPLYLLFLLVLAAAQQHGTFANGESYYGSPLQSSIAMQTSMPTVTVRGFLNFRTTVDGTVIVFTPSPSVGQQSTSNMATNAPTMTTHPSERIPEIRPTRINKGPVQSYPTGLVTVLGGTLVQGGATTVFETKVIGTYISGKYAQILSSTTKVRPNEQLASPTVWPSIQPTNSFTKPIVQPTRTVLAAPKAPVFREENLREEETTTNAVTAAKKVHPLRAKANKLIENSKARHLNARLQLNPLKSRWAKASNIEDQVDSETRENNKPTTKVLKARVGNRRFSLPPRQLPKVKMSRFKSKLPPTQAEEMQQYYNFKSKEQISESNKSKENNVSSGIDLITKEKILENLNSTATSVSEANDQNIEEKPAEIEPSIDPSKVIKEVQTITSEVTQHVEGNHLQVKTLTLTTTIARTLHPSESEFDTQLVKPTLDLSVNDLEATSVPETPALVISRTYSVTERTMRTTVVPVFDGTATQSHTVTESFFIRKLITAYRTLPPGDVIMIDSTTSTPTNGLNTELINGTEIADLSMAEQSIQPSSVEGTLQATQMPTLLGNGNQEGTTNVMQPLMPSIDSSLGLEMPKMFPPSQFAQKFDLNNPLLLAAVLQNPQLAAVYLGLQQMKQQATQYNTLTKPTQILTTETVYNTKIVSFYDGRQTRSRTILEPAGTTEKVFNTFTVQLVPVMNPNLAMQQAQLQNVLATQLGILPQFQTTPIVQSTTNLRTVTTVTDTTLTKSKVYTLVYNAFSTRYRTITSTSVIPTTITTVVTDTINLNSASSMPMPNMNYYG